MRFIIMLDAFLDNALFKGLIALITCSATVYCVMKFVPGTHYILIPLVYALCLFNFLKHLELILRYITLQAQFKTMHELANTLHGIIQTYIKDREEKEFENVTGLHIPRQDEIKPS